MRVGVGYDSHRFADGEGRKLVLGGVEIPHPRGLVGHSDADAVAHALTDAILGAAGLGDIGTMFPPTNPRWKDADSLDLLKRAYLRVVEAGLSFVSADITVVTERPRLAPYIDDMRERLAGALVLSHLGGQCRRPGASGIFVPRLLPAWPPLVPPFAGLAGLSAPRALVPLARASGVWYGALTLSVAALGTNLDAVVSLLSRLNRVLGVVALGDLIFLGVLVVLLLKRPWRAMGVPP